MRSIITKLSQGIFLSFIAVGTLSPLVADTATAATLKAASRIRDAQVATSDVYAAVPASPVAVATGAERGGQSGCKRTHLSHGRC